MRVNFWITYVGHRQRGDVAPLFLLMFWSDGMLRILLRHVNQLVSQFDEIIIAENIE